MEYGLLCKPTIVYGIVMPKVCRVAAFQCEGNKCRVELAEAPPIKATPICEEKK